MWPLFSTSPNTPVTTPDGGKIPGWGSPIRAYRGRTIDSSGLGDQVGGVHALRARIIRYYPALNRVIQIQGPRIASYFADRLFAQLGSPMIQTNAGYCLPPAFSFRYPDSAGGDVRDVLYDFDVDDRGYVVAAFDPYGSVLLDPSLNVVYRFMEGASPLAATKVTALHGLGGVSAYFVEIHPQLGQSRTYDVTDPFHPVLTGVNSAPRTRSHESSAGGWSMTFGPDADLGGYGNIKLFKSGVRVPCKVPGTDLEFFAAAYNDRYASGGHFVGPAFCGIIGGEDMTDAQLFGLPDGRVLLVVAAGGLCDWFELESSGTVVQPPVIQPPVTPPVIQPPLPIVPFDVGAVQSFLNAAQQAITNAQAVMAGATVPPVQPPPVVPPQPPPVVPPTPPPIVVQPPQPPIGPAIGSPCDRSTPLPDGLVCVDGKVRAR